MKKKYLIVTLVAFFTMIFVIPNVQAVDITGCRSILPNARIDVKIANIVHLVITVIKIAIPILLVIFGMLDLMKGITAQKDDEIKKGQQIFVKRLIAAALVFFVVSIVQLLISVVSTDDKDKNNIATCVSCFLNGANSSSGVCNK